MIPHCRGVMVSFLVAAIAFAGATTGLHAEGWDSIPAFSGTIVIESETAGPSTRIAGATGVWVRYTPALSIDCSPPRGCYASSQRIYYAFGCAPRYAVVVERISMDLNGAVIRHEMPGNYAASKDEAANRILNAFCGVRDRD